MHRQTATAIFLLFFLYPSTIILIKVTIETSIAANAKEPICFVKIHFKAVEIGLP